jgi:hypothetical protein
MSPRCTAAPITPSPARPRNPLGDKRDGSLPLKTIGREEPFSSTPYRIPLSHWIRVTGRLLYMYVTVHVLTLLYMCSLLCTDTGVIPLPSQGLRGDTPI